MPNTALDSRARRAAERVGLYATKSRLRRDSVDNHGGYMLTRNNTVVYGDRYDLSAEDVLEICRELRAADR